MPQDTSVERILQLWKEEVDAICEWGALFKILLRPQIIGRPTRLAIVQILFEYMRGFSNVWLATSTSVTKSRSTLYE
jgi:peptidoglycan-N-acetylglucosamine deacetylase